MGFLFGGSGGTTVQGGSNSTANTTYTPEYNNYVNDILAKGTSLSQTPFPAYDISKMFAPFSADQTQAQNQIRQGQNAWQPYGQAATGALNNVSGYDPAAAAAPYLNRAGSTPDPFAAGAGYLSRGAQSWGPQQQAQYMNPFASQAVGRANQLTNQNFFENVLPGINDQFVKSGGSLGRDRYSEFMGRATRDLMNTESGNANTTMASNYWNGANQFNADANRMGATGTAMGNLASSSMGALGQLGNTAANITSGAVNTGVGLSNAYSGLGGALSNLNLQNSNALNTVGQQQQQQAQLPLSAQYQQFQNSVQWPFQMANFQSSLQRGLQIPTTQNTNTNQWQTQSQNSSPSIAGSILGGAGALMSIPGVANWTGGMLGNMFGGGPSLPAGASSPAGAYQPTGTQPVKRGGQINRYAQGGQAFGPIVEPRGALRRRRPLRFAVGGSVPVVRGINQATRRQMQARGPQGALGGMPGMSVDAPPPGPPLRPMTMPPQAGGALRGMR